MSFVRIIPNPTAGGTGTDYTDVWDIKIDPYTITGADYFSYEAQKASFKMPYVAGL
jgi:hypothetical protein